MEKKFCAVYGMMKNEAKFLPIWMKYYGSLFGYENLYIMDHQSTDGSTVIPSTICNVEVIKHVHIHDNNWMLNENQRKQRELLEDYKYVISVDADEIIVPDPEKYTDLVEYLTKLEKDCVRCKGYEVMHMRREEKESLNWSKPILGSQRKYWIRLTSYDKPLIASRPIWWVQGRHFEHDRKNDPIEEDLLLIHLHRVDYEYSKNKSMREREMVQVGRRKMTIASYPNVWVGKQFDDYFDGVNSHIRWGAKPTHLELIPEKYKDII